MGFIFVKKQHSSSSSEQVTGIEVPPLTSKAITLPRRPGYGTLGKKCMVRASHFQVEVEDRDYCQYNVSFFSSHYSISCFCFDLVRVIDMVSLFFL